MPIAANLQLAFRVLNTIRFRDCVKQADALALRMWATRGTQMGPLEDIAWNFIENVSPDRLQRPANI
jgi:hypothetical protein